MKHCSRTRQVLLLPRRPNARGWVLCLYSSLSPDFEYPILALFGNSSTENLRSEETTLCPLDDLLVDRLRWVVHDNCALLVVDLGVNTCITDQIYNPLLAFILAET